MSALQRRATPGRTARPRGSRRQRADDDQGARTACRRQERHHADHGRAEFRQPAACDRGGAPGGAAGRYQVSAAGRHARVQARRSSAKFKRDSGIDYALDEICVGNGGKQCLFNAIMATVDPGDEVVIPVPSWIAYAQMTQLCRGHAGVRQLSAEQRLPSAPRGHRRGDHAEHQVADPEQSEQSDRGGDERRRHEGDRRGDAQASACLDPVRRHV